MLICEEAEAYKRGWVTCSILEKWTSWDEEQVFLPSNPCSLSPSGNHVWLLQKIMLVETCVFRACMGLWASSLALSVILSRHCSFGQRAYNCRRWWSLVVQAGHSLHAYEITHSIGWSCRWGDQMIQGLLSPCCHTPVELQFHILRKKKTPWLLPLRG